MLAAGVASLGGLYAAVDDQMGIRNPHQVMTNGHAYGWEHRRGERTVLFHGADEPATIRSRKPSSNARLMRIESNLHTHQPAAAIEGGLRSAQQARGMLIAEMVQESLRKYQIKVSVPLIRECANIHSKELRRGIRRSSGIEVRRVEVDANVIDRWKELEDFRRTTTDVKHTIARPRANVAVRDLGARVGHGNCTLKPVIYLRHREQPPRTAAPLASA